MISISIYLRDLLELNKNNIKSRATTLCAKKRKNSWKPENLYRVIYNFTQFFQELFMQWILLMDKGSKMHRLRKRQMWNPNPGTLFPNSDPRVFHTTQLAEK